MAAAAARPLLACLRTMVPHQACHLSLPRTTRASALTLQAWGLIVNLAARVSALVRRQCIRPTVARKAADSPWVGILAHP